MPSHASSSSHTAIMHEEPKPRVIFLHTLESTTTHILTVDSSLLCSASPYFQALLMGSFSESGTSSITIPPEHPYWIVQCFINWITLDRLHTTPLDASTFTYEMLFQLYHFADYYDVRSLRNFLVEQVQKKLYRHDRATRVVSDFPTPSECEYLCEDIAATTPLRRCIAQAICNFNVRSPAPGQAALSFQDLRGKVVVPEEFVEDVNESRSRQCEVISCKECSVAPGCEEHSELEHPSVRNTKRGWCLFHEHENEEEMKRCQQRRALT